MPGLKIGAAILLAAVAHPVAAQTPTPQGGSARTVTLSLAEYNRLIDLATPAQPDQSLAPVAAVVASADLRIRVERESVRGVFELNGDVLRPGINRVTLLSGATLLDASMNGQPVPLVADSSAHAALLPGPGPFSIAVDWAGPLTIAPGRASFMLPVPSSGTARATFDLPGEQADVRLSAGLVTRRTVADGRTLVEATLDPGVPTQVSWSMRDSAPVAAAREVRMLGDVFTLVTLGDSDVRMVALLDVTVVQGEPRTIGVRLPAGYELTSLVGPTLETSGQIDRTLTLTVSDPAARRHQFLVGLERPHEGGSFTLATSLVALPDVQRERGEVAVEGVGTLEATIADREDLVRIDVRELNLALRRLARNPLLSAFRYQGTSAGPPELALDVRRFGDVGVLAAVADRARATTVVTSEGRALTEIALLVQNRAQPFLKVTLPAGASIVSVDIAGESAKPALGADGTTRVPLLRAGFRPSAPYPVSFVYMHTSVPFARRGDLQMQLPRLDIPVGLIEWEVFMPSGYSVRQIEGNVMDGSLTRSGAPVVARGGASHALACTPNGTASPRTSTETGTIAGQVRDASGGSLPGVTVEAHSNALVERVRSTTTDQNGRYEIAALPPGRYCVLFSLEGFERFKRENVTVNAGATAGTHASMRVGKLQDTVRVVAESPIVDLQNARQRIVFQGSEIRDLPTTRSIPDLLTLAPGVTAGQLSGICSGGTGLFCNPDGPRFNASSAAGEAGVAQGRIVVDGMSVDQGSGGAAGQGGGQAVDISPNVTNLQRRVAGVLPVRVDVPRAGTSYWFVKPLMVDQEATVTLRYRRR